MIDAGLHVRGTNQEKRRDLEVLDRSQVGLQLEFGKNDSLITTVGTGMIYDHKSINVALWQQTKPNFREWRYAGGARASISVATLEHFGLQYVGDNIAMRNHDSFL